MNLNQFWLDQLTEGKSNWVNQIIQLHQERGYQVIRLTGKSHVYSKRQLPNQEKQLDYQLHVTFLIKKNQRFYREEQCRPHRAYFYKKILQRDEELPEQIYDDADYRSNLMIELTPTEALERFVYDRSAAVRYAEHWWNDANPAYQFFEVNDCTDRKSVV